MAKIEIPTYQHRAARGLARIIREVLIPSDSGRGEVGVRGLAECQ